jgi:hypothetical protein
MVLISLRKLEMSGRRETLAELAMRQQMQAASRVHWSGWRERHGAQTGLVVLLATIIGVVVWRFFA